MTGEIADSFSPARHATRFAGLLRAEGVTLGPDATTAYTRALDLVGFTHRDTVYWTGRATLIDRVEDVPAFDRAFSRFWSGPAGPDGPNDPPPPDEVVIAFDDPDDAGDPTPTDDEDMTVVRYSAVEVLRTRDLARCTPDELADAQRLIEAFRLRVPHRPGRRRRPGGRHGDPLDVRRTVRGAVRRGGEVVDLPTRVRPSRPRRLVLLCDVSGSMEPYARTLLRFMHVAAASGQAIEAFAFATRLTRLTRHLRTRDPDEALRRAATAVDDMSGGTRLGEILRTFNDQWGVRGLARGAVVVILSDGWDRGDPDLLGDEVARLSRVASRLVWANPLSGDRDYRPVARGMAAALPHVDELVPAHSVAALEDLLELLDGAITP